MTEVAPDDQPATRILPSGRMSLSDRSAGMQFTERDTSLRHAPNAVGDIRPPYLLYRDREQPCHSPETA